MFTWLEKLLGRLYNRCAPEEQYDIYRPRERLIYQYFDGQQVIKADPIVIYKRLMARGPEIDIDRKVAASESKDALKAHDNLVSKLREVFEVKTLKEGGLSDTEVTTLLDHYLLYTDTVKKKVSLYQTLPESLEASEQPSADNPTMLNSSVSGSTANGSSTVKQAASPSGWASH